MKKRIFQKGFTLTEVIIVVAIFIFIIIIIYSIYILSQKSYRGGEDVAEITQNGRVVLERLAREIRQTREIATDLPEEQLNPPSEIEFQDGHTPARESFSAVYGATENTLTLSPASAKEDDYFKDLYVRIKTGLGAGQIRKILSFDGDTTIATIEGTWDIIPDATSSYIIDSSFYYIHYYLQGNNILRRVLTYCFSQDSINCNQPENYTPWNAAPPPNNQLIEVVLEQPRAVGEYVANLDFWGSRIINISIEFESKGKNINLKTEIFGRNL